ncbi:MAG: hypothetical protein V8Q71_02300 [Bacilli bacterium]
MIILLSINLPIHLFIINILIIYQKFKEKLLFVTKAEDKCLSVACGSLISRYVLIKEFEKLSKQMGVRLPEGAGQKVDEVGAELIKTHGIEILKEIAKYNFKNTDKIKELAK